MAPHFSCQTFDLDGSVLVVLAGELDVCGVDELRAACDPLARRYDADQMTIDCTDLRFIDACGLGALVRVLNRFAPTGRPALRNASDRVRVVLSLTGLDERFRLLPSNQLA